MESLKITFEFSAPVLRDSEYPIHLDALVASSLAREHEESGSPDPWTASEDLSSVFDKTDGEDWVWKSSQILFKPALQKQWMNQTRRSDPSAYMDDLGVYWRGDSKRPDDAIYTNGVRHATCTISTGSGHNRGYQWLNAIQWMHCATAYAIADKEALEHYLSMLTHIGKKGRNGWGQIKSLLVEPAAADEAENWQIRVMPQGQQGKIGVQYEPVIACLRAPYWKKANRVLALEPIY